MSTERPGRSPGSLPEGSRLGPYTIGELLGSGGMGEVYRAHDPKLTRDVAIKVVRPSLLGDPSRLARFEREARLLASLQHPHIAAVFGFEESGATSGLVMELVEGPTLAERLLRGALPLDETLAIALQVAEALEAAHERGIVHRDLKPPNVKLADGDQVKVLDFGLAKALDIDASTPEAALAPTLTAATALGLVLGTPAYMSPEQAQGKPVDRRTDVWAFGCLLYEMLTGVRAFGGATVTQTLAAVLHGEPEESLLPASTPPRLRDLIRRCLQKEPRKRLQAIGDGRILIEELLAGEAPGEDAPQRRLKAAGSRAARVAAALLAALLAALAAWSLKPSHPASQPVVRFTIVLPAGQLLVGSGEQSLALSTDGKRLAYVATEEGEPPRIFVRDLDRAAAEPIAGTEGAIDPFFSPDGEWLGFFADGKLRKIPVRGGVARTLAVAAAPRGGTWSPEHRIDFGVYPSAIVEVPDGGGAGQAATRIESGETDSWPDALPGGRALLFRADSSGSSAIVARAAASGSRKILVEGQAAHLPRYLAPGYLLYGQGGDLLAAPFDADRLELRGEAVRVVKGVLQYAVSGTGALAYVVGTPPSLDGRLVWVGRDGRIEKVLGGPPRFYYQPRVEPHGQRIVADVVGTTLEVWLYDPTRDTIAPFTFGGLNRHGIWTPDGKRVAFMSKGGIFWQAADGSGGLEQLTELPAGDAPGTLDIPCSWSPDGRQLAFVRYLPTRDSELMVASLDGRPAGAAGRPAPRRVLELSTADDGPQFSPDGRWLAYAGEDERGRRQIFVRAFPGPGGIHQVSVEGGNEPRWNPNGRELFFRNGDEMLAVDVATAPVFSQGTPRGLFHDPYLKVQPSFVRANYDVSTDGQRFLMVELVEREPPLTEIHVVLNWVEELRRLAPAHG